MEGKLIFLTGPPGVGKSTVADILVAQIEPLRRIGFGELLYERVRRDHSGLQYDQMRQEPTRYISTRHIALASEDLLVRVGESRTRTNILVDTHAITLDDYGLRLTPHTEDFLRRARIDAIVVLHADVSAVTRRVEAAPAGRRIPSTEDLLRMMRVQEAIAVTYAVVCGCQVFYLPIINRETTRDFIRVCDAIGMEYQVRGDGPAGSQQH